MSRISVLNQPFGLSHQRVKAFVQLVVRIIVAADTFNYQTKKYFCRCYYSKQIFETWENVGDHFANNKTIVIAEIDCEEYKSLCRNFKIREYPVLVMFKNGAKFEKYVGPRTKEDLIEYIDNFLKPDTVNEL